MCRLCTISILSLQNKATGAESLFLATIIATLKTLFQWLGDSHVLGEDYDEWRGTYKIFINLIGK